MNNKKYYRLEEVATRWNCTVDDLLYYAKEGELAIALSPEPITGRFYYILNPSAFSVSESGTNGSDAVLVAHTPEHARGLLTDADGNILLAEAWEAMPETERKEAERRIYRRNRLSPAYLWNRTFTTDNLFISHEELERYERENEVHDESPSVSDAALGKYQREKLQRFANCNRERSGARQPEWDRWRQEAEKIQSQRTRPASKQQLAGLVKNSLNLPDSVETIRKRI